MLGALLARRFPRLAGQLRAAEAPLGDIVAPWFHSLFVTALPAEAAARVWDVLLLEGPKVLFRVALALLKVRAHACARSARRGLLVGSGVAGPRSWAALWQYRPVWKVPSAAPGRTENAA